MAISFGAAFRPLYQPPGVHTEGAEAGFDFEEGDSLVEYLGREVGGLHDFFAGAGAVIDSLEDFGLDISVAKEVELGVFLILLDVVFGK